MLGFDGTQVKNLPVSISAWEAFTPASVMTDGFLFTILAWVARIEMLHLYSGPPLGMLGKPEGPPGGQLLK